MPDINITVAHKVAVSDTQSIVCDNSDYTVHWTLDEEWAAYDTKTMRTIYMDGTFKDTVFSGDTVELPCRAWCRSACLPATSARRAWQSCARCRLCGLLLARLPIPRPTCTTS